MEKATELKYAVFNGPARTLLLALVSYLGKRYSSLLRATTRHLPHGITQCYLPPDTSELAQPKPSQTDWCSIYLPRRDGRLS